MAIEGYIQTKHREVKIEVDRMMDEIQRLRSELKESEKLISSLSQWALNADKIKLEREKELEKLYEMGRKYNDEVMFKFEGRMRTHVNKQLDEVKDLVNHTINDHMVITLILQEMLIQRGIFSREDYLLAINEMWDGLVNHLKQTKLPLKSLELNFNAASKSRV